jgi:AcrR family transcriptional regulator
MRLCYHIDMTGSRQVGERINQKRRTRMAVVTAAAELLRQGRAPSVAEAAASAGVSRATAYRYFPSQDLLLVEAALEAVLPDVQALLAASELSADPEARLDALVRAVQAMVVTNEPAFRTMLRLSLEPQPLDQSSEDDRSPFRRGGRRVSWLQEVLASTRHRLGAQRFRHLLAALSLLLGIETQVVLRDVCGLEVAEAEDVARWAAQALLRAALAEADAART